MNALRTNALRAVTKQVGRQQMRSKATVAVSPKAASPLPPHLQNQSFQKTWLSDPSTYPIMVIMGCGLTFMVGMGFNALFGYKDVQINPNKRGAMLQNWGQEERRGVVRRFQEDFKEGPSNPEGLGIDHAEWVKQRAEYLSK